MIKFDKISDEEISILLDGKFVGNIFTPSGSGKNNLDCIQICGFDDAFDLWGCANFMDENGRPKKDIQLKFNGNTVSRNRQYIDMDCTKCFNMRNHCSCDDLIIKREDDLQIKKIKDYGKDETVKEYEQ